MTTILFIGQEKFYCDCVFSALMGAKINDTLNLIFLSPSRRFLPDVNVNSVDIVIYDFRGFDKSVIALVQKIRKQNPNVFVLNLISDGDNVVRTDPNIEYLHRKNGFDMLAEIINSVILKTNKTRAMSPVLQNTSKRERCFAAASENLGRLNGLDTLFLGGDRQGFVSLYRDILEVAFNQMLIDPDLSPVIVKTMSAYLYSFFYRHKLDLLFSPEQFFAPLNSPKPLKNQISRVFLKISDMISQKDAVLSESVAVLRAKEFIKKNLFKDISLTQVADELGLNPSYLSRIFKKDSGESMSEYMAKLKIDSAKGFLLSGNMSVNDVSVKLGFRSVNYFIRFFKKHTGLPPSLWREKTVVN